MSKLTPIQFKAATKGGKMSKSDDLTIAITEEALQQIKSGEITKYVFGWQRPDKAGNTVISTNDLSGLKMTVHSAITTARK